MCCHKGGCRTEKRGGLSDCCNDRQQECHCCDQCTCGCQKEYVSPTSCCEDVESSQESQVACGSGSDASAHECMLKELEYLHDKLEEINQKLETIGYRLYEEIEAVGEKIDSQDR